MVRRRGRVIATLALTLLAGALVAVLAHRRRQRTRGGASAVSANKDVIRRLVDEVWANRNLAAADELVAAGYVGHDPTLGEPAHGPQGFKDAAAVYQTAFPDASIAIEELVAEGDRVVARWTGRGTHQGELMGIAPTGKQITVSGITVSRLEGGKVVEEWTVYDALGMLMQLGAVPQPTPA